MAAVGDACRAAGVRAIYLVHGTFVGADALGVLRELARVSPTAAEPLRRLQKQLLDAIARDAGNYTPAYAATFDAAINQDAQPHLPVRLFHWSSENHHVGRADGAVRLMDELASCEELRQGRVLVWGHSHGGNVLALITNLLAADAEMRTRFFHAGRSYYRWPGTDKVDMPEWVRVQQMLERDEHPLMDTAVDLATFGTPVRYGWDSDGYDHLLHFIHHRPVPGLAEDRAVFPPEVEDVMCARYGDYIQQVGIAGTNFTPAVWAWRAWLADVRLGGLVQAGIRKRDLLTRLKRGVRTHDEGVNLLIDYGQPEGHVGQHVAGHAVYTRLEWLLFHAEEVARRFYNLPTKESCDDGRNPSSDGRERSG